MEGRDSFCLVIPLGTCLSSSVPSPPLFILSNHRSGVAHLFGLDSVPSLASHVEHLFPICIICR